MDTVKNIFAQARQTGAQPVSFEIFPPKGELSMESARTIAQELAKLDRSSALRIPRAAAATSRPPLKSPQ